MSYPAQSLGASPHPNSGGASPAKFTLSVFKPWFPSLLLAGPGFVKYLNRCANLFLSEKNLQC